MPIPTSQAVDEILTQILDNEHTAMQRECFAALYDSNGYLGAVLALQEGRIAVVSFASAMVTLGRLLERREKQVGSLEAMLSLETK